MTDGGGVVRVFVKSKAKEARLELAKDGRLLAYITEPKEGGRANEEIKKMLAEEFGVEVKAVRLLSGHTGQAKVFKIFS